jgi:hypothetical protein
VGIPDEISNHAKGIVIRPVDFQVVDVAINLNEGLLVWIQQYYEAIELRLNQQGANMVPFTMEELTLYVKTLIRSRVAWTRNDPGMILHYSERVVVPSFLSFVLSGLGRVELPELGIELRPAYISDEVMTKEAAIMFSAKLKPLSSLGFEFAEGYSRDKTGAMDLMVLQMVEGQILSHTDKGHPAYAVAAYFLGLLQVVNLLGPRVLYGTREQMRMILRLVASE